MIHILVYTSKLLAERKTGSDIINYKNSNVNSDKKYI